MVLVVSRLDAIIKDELSSCFHISKNSACTGSHLSLIFRTQTGYVSCVTGDYNVTVVKEMRRGRERSLSFSPSETSASRELRVLILIENNVFLSQEIGEQINIHYCAS